MSAKTFNEMLAHVPDPGDTEVSHLRDTLAIFTEMKDDEMAITATSNVYGLALRTGLTWGDLRGLLFLLDELYEDSLS